MLRDSLRRIIPRKRRRKVVKDRRVLSGSSTITITIIDVLSLVLFSGLAERIRKTFDLDRVIRSAGIPIHPLIYSARVATMLIASIIIGISIILVGVMIYINTPMIMLIFILAGVFTPVLVFSLSLLYPIARISSRRNTLEAELPFFVSYAAIMSRGNISLPKVLERFSEIKLFEGLRREARLFLREVKVFGRDPITALENLAAETPSPLFKDLLMGYVTVLRIGGDLTSYLESKADDLFTKFSERIKSIIERMGLIIEIYMILAVVLTLSLFVLFVSAGGLQILGVQGGISNMLIGAYLFIFLPLMSVITIFIVHYSQPKQVVILRKTFDGVIIGSILGVVSGLILLILTNGYLYLYGVINKVSALGVITSATIPLIVLSGVVWYYYRRETREAKGINEKTTYFLEDVSEARRTGLSPERAIIQAMRRDYGSLTPIVRRIGIALSIGMDVSTAIRSSLSEIKSRFVRIMFRFLIDSINVGGGSPDVMYSLAKFSRSLSELESRLRGSLRSYVIMPYIAAVLLSISSILFLTMLLQAPISTGGVQTKIDPSALYNFIILLSIGISVNSWIMGLVAGKISELSLGEGFKHGFILLIISLIIQIIMISFYVNI
ncbi:MAG: type II secretion system F family protein [Sulfolobales archaeon]